MLFSKSKAAAVALVASSYLTSSQAFKFSFEQYFDFSLSLNLPSFDECSTSEDSLLQIGINENLNLDIDLFRRELEQEAAAYLRGTQRKRDSVSVPKAALTVTDVAYVKNNLYKVTVNFETAAPQTLNKAFAGEATSVKVNGLGVPEQSSALVFGSEAKAGINNIFQWSATFVIEASFHNGLFCLPDDFSISFEFGANASSEALAAWKEYYPTDYAYTLDDDYSKARSVSNLKRSVDPLEIQKRDELDKRLLSLGFDLDVLLKIGTPKLKLPNFCWKQECVTSTVSPAPSTTTVVPSSSSVEPSTTTLELSSSSAEPSPSSAQPSTTTVVLASSSAEPSTTTLSPVAEPSSSVVVVESPSAEPSSSTIIVESSAEPSSSTVLVESSLEPSSSTVLVESSVEPSSSTIIVVSPSAESASSTATHLSSELFSSITFVESPSSEPSASTTVTLAPIADTVTNIATTVITVTSCEDHKCTAIPVTTGLTTVTENETIYTTYCPLPTTTTTAKPAIESSTSPAPETPTSKAPTTVVTLASSSPAPAPSPTAVTASIESVISNEEGTSTVVIDTTIYNTASTTTTGVEKADSSVALVPGTESTVPTVAAESTVPTVAAESTIPVVAGESTIPVVAGESTIPAVAGESTAPTVAAESTAPTVVAESTAPTVAAESTAPTVAAESTAPTVAAESTAPTVAAESTSPTVAGESAAPTVAGESIVPTGTASEAPEAPEQETSSSAAPIVSLETGYEGSASSKAAPFGGILLAGAIALLSL